MDYAHKGLDLYSQPATRTLNSASEQIGFHEDRPFLGLNGAGRQRYYRGSVINDREIRLPSDGRYTLEAIYKTQSNRFSEPQGIRETTTAVTFAICAQSNTTCRLGYRSPASESAQDQATRLADMANATINGTAGRAQWCGRDGDQCGGGGGGGGGIYGGDGGYTPPAWFQLPVLHTAAMGPFFAASGIGSSTSRGEIEDLLESLSPAQLDGIADIIEEAYGEDVYEYLRVPPSAVTAAQMAPDAEASPLLTFLAPLDAADPGGLGGLYLDRLLDLRTRYLAGAPTVAGRGAGSLATLSAPDGSEAAASDALSTTGNEIRGGAAVWPNPATTRLNVRTPEAAMVAVHDVSGRLVARLPVGSNITTWDLNGTSGARVAAGVYQVVVSDGRGARRSTAVTIL